MYCKHCGKEIAEDAFMCPSCGSPTGTASPVKVPKTEAVTNENAAHYSGLAAAAFILSLVAFVTGIIFGAFFFVYTASALLLYVLSATTVLPAIASLALGVYLLCVRSRLSQSAKAFAIVAIVLSSVAALFLFIGGCVLITDYNVSNVR